MGVEALGGIGRTVSIAPSVGRVATIGPSIGRMFMPAPEVGFSITRIANPFIKAPTYIENKVPSLLGPTIDVIKNPFKVEAPKPQLRAADVIAEAEAIVRKAAQAPSVIARTPSETRATKQSLDFARDKSNSEITTLSVYPEPAIVRLPNPARGLDVREIKNPFPRVEVSSQPASASRAGTESRATSRIVRTTSTPTFNQTQVEQVVEEKKLVLEDKKEDKTKAKKSEEQSVTKIKIVEAVKVTQLRRSAIFEAVRRVKEEAEKRAEKVIITGKKLKKFLSAEFWKYISPLVGRVGYDGTIPLTLNAIENNPTEYTNLQEAQRRLSQPVAEHIPLEKGEGGRVATVGEVREVLEGKEKEAIRSQTPAEMVVRRLVRKSEVVKGEQVVTVATEEKVESSETSLKDFPASAEVFQKAA